MVAGAKVTKLMKPHNKKTRKSSRNQSSWERSLVGLR